MPKYRTRQRELLLQFLSENTDKSFSAVQAAERLKDKDISLSAVYRNLASLEAEGKLKRTSKSGSREVYYQYIAAPGCSGCIHLSCLVCGRTYHMDKNTAQRLTESVAADGFTISRSDTVLYGTCNHCKEKGI